MAIRLSASLAAASLPEMKEVLPLLSRLGVEMLHFDVEDGQFVPSLTLGTKIIGDLRSHSQLTFDVHLSVNQPERLIPEVIQMGADRVAVHWEACDYPMRTLEMIRDGGALSGLAFNPKTPIPELGYFIPILDYILVLSTEPVIPECEFIPEMANKIFENKPIYRGTGLEWVIDGGIQPENVAVAAGHGADILVVGRGIFKDGDIEKNVQTLIEACTDRWDSNPPLR
jgi:ribulose-phosphate 3-epimerase